MTKRKRKQKRREFQARQRQQESASVSQVLEKYLVGKVDLSFRNELSIGEISLTRAPQIVRDRFVHFCDYLLVATASRTAAFPSLAGGNVHCCLTYWTPGPWDMMNDEGLGTHFGFISSVVHPDFAHKPAFLILKVDSTDKLNVAICNDLFMQRAESFIREIAAKKRVLRVCTTVMDGTPCEEWVTAGFLILDCI